MKRFPWIVFGLLTLEIAFLAFLYLNKSLRLAGEYGFPLDDSWIHAVFARNIAEGHGFVYNLGQPSSSTAPLYTLLLSSLYLLKIAPVFNAVTLGLILHLAAAMLIYAAASHLSNSKWLPTFCSLIFAATPRLIWGALSGMEVPLYVFMVTLGLYLHILYHWYDGAKVYLTTAAFALAALARPECGAFIVFSILDRVFASWRSEERPGELRRYLKTIPFHIGVCAIILAPVIAFNLSYSGHPLPPAFYAKVSVFPHAKDVGAAILARLAIMRCYLYQAASVIIDDNSVLAIGLLPGITVCLSRLRKRSNNSMLLMLMGILIMPPAIGTISPITEIPALQMQHGRYSSYLIPFATLVGGLGWIEVIRFARAKLTVYASLASIALILVFAIGLIEAGCSNNIESLRYALEVQNINQMQVGIGKWAAHLPKNRVIACNDIGAIAYFSRRTVIDTVGIVNPEVIPHLKEYSDKQIGLMKYLQQRRPDYLIIFPNWYPDIARRMDVLQPVMSVNLPVNVICGGDEMIIYRTHWQH